MNHINIRILAHYLPQFHPTPENDEWWGPGFTEWTNVGRARPLFRGHQQPKVPAHLGYYDLRVPEVRELQAKLAQEAGVDGFCYWHYWFGHGRRMLEMPFNEVLRTGRPDFPFCLGWANHTWYDKSWTPEKWYSKKVLIEQTYPGPEDITDHFNAILPAFRDKRYFRVEARPLFLVYDPFSVPDIAGFIKRWNDLADKHGIGGIFFVALTNEAEKLDMLKVMGFDAMTLSLHHRPFGGRATSIAARLERYAKTFLTRMPNIVDYAEAINQFYDPCMRREDVFPSLIPNFDHTPRSGILGRAYYNSTPRKFGEHVEKILDNVVHKQPERQIAFLKSWNEWGEGNYLEPDLKWGKAYIEELARVKRKVMPR
jgi:hypothetical protein